MSDHPYDSEAPATAVHDFSDIRAKLAQERTRDRNLLVRMNGSFVGQVLSLDDGTPCTIGRSPDSRVWVHEDGVSRRHARIDKGSAGFWLSDLGSSNGTFVNGQRIEGQSLEDGDLIEIGDAAMFRYTRTDADHERMLVTLYEASVRDPLTGAFNREHFADRLRAEISFARRHKTEVGLVMFDLDHFKQVNDRFGHPAGDEMLIALVEVVRATIRLEDVLARYGGEEFAVIVRHIPLPGLCALAERLRQKIAAIRLAGELGAIEPTASFGCAILADTQRAAPEELIEVADRRLFEAKKRGRNCVVP